MKQQTVYIAVLCLACIAFGVTLRPVSDRIDAYLPPSESRLSGSPPGASTHLLSIAEIQQMISDRGYKIKVDGMLCVACYNPDHSETQALWDRAYGDQTAIELWPEDAQ